MALSNTHTSSQQQPQLPFSIESFTYSWCINLNPPSLESLSNSLRFSLDHTLSDYFDIDLLHLQTASDDGDDHGSLPCGNMDSSSSSSTMRRSRSFMSKKMLKRYLGFLLIMPILRKLRRGIKSGKRMSSKVDALDEYQSFNNVGNWRNSSDSAETSIYEAVLHCKRSIGDL